MGSLFRSEEMRLCQLFLQTEAAYACVSELGELGLVEFKDLNEELNAFQRKFVSEVRRCEEMERKLRYMEKELHKEGMKIIDLGDPAPKAPPPKEMIDLEVAFDKIDFDLREVNANHEALKQNFLELTEVKEVLQKTQYYFTLYGRDIQNMMDEETSGAEESIASSRGQGAQLAFTVGTIAREKVFTFERVLKYYTHNNVFVRTEDISKPLEDPVTGEMLNKTMFLIFYQGEQLKGKVKKVCEGMRCSVYSVPESSQERETMLSGVNTRLADLENVLKQTGNSRLTILEKVQRSVRNWTIKVEKIKAIFHTLNMFKSSQNSLIAECWCPIRALDDIKECLSRGEKISGSTIPTIIQPMLTDETPPTYYNCNKFVKGFQAIVDAYGVSTYGEVNPAPYTCITFPFLFAVMFGDAGHGLIMFLFGAWMCIKEKSLSATKTANEIWNTFFGGRYIIMMMGLFSIYTGLIYNDAFSRSLNIFGSQWEPSYSNAEITDNDKIIIDPNLFHINGTAYFLGVDPIWQSASNKISFLNSLKMKMAIILGVSHMIFGICLSVFNHLHFKRMAQIFVQFLPEMLFLGCLFGYLVILVIYKWLAYDAATSKCSPPLLIQYINMFMFKYKIDDVPCQSKDPQSTFYEGQKVVQIIMFLLAILSVPVLLFVRPGVEIFSLWQKGEISFGDGSKADPMKSNLVENEVPPARPITTEHAMSQHNYTEDGAVNPSLNSDENADASIMHMSYQKRGENPKAEGGAREKDNKSLNPENAASSIGHMSYQSQGEEVNLGFRDENGGMGFDPEAAMKFDSGAPGGEKHEIGEILIENIIETIEFCLGCISHTASYLRLWALSLAHAQLSEVLWTMVMHMGFTIGGKYVGGIILFVIFIAWANLTIGILLLMEGLSAFLHTLRLHWVEFQSKFYKGTGYHFQPFNFKQIVELESLQDID